MRVAVIGATGFIGATISERLASAGHDVIAWGRRRAPGNESWASPFKNFFIGDVEDENVVNRIADCRAEAWIYCVSLDHHETELDIDRALRINVAPVWRLLDRLRKAGRSRQSRFLYLSTSQVYGSVTGSVSETSPLCPRNHYALTHLMAENVTARYHRAAELHNVSLRLANGYGAPRFADANCWWLVINDLCRSAVTAREIRLKSDGTPQRDFVHTRDIARAVQILIEAPEETLRHAVYNVGSGQTYTILEAANIIADRYARRFGERIPVIVPRSDTRINALSHVRREQFCYGIDRLAGLGFKVKTRLAQGIEEIFDYLVKEGKTS